MTGDYVVTDFTAAVANTDTDNASFALVLVHKADGLKERRIALYDGLFALSAVGTPSATVTLDELEVSNLPAGDLTWYALEGDVTLGEGEFVQVKGLPGKGTACCSTIRTRRTTRSIARSTPWCRRRRGSPASTSTASRWPRS